MKLSKSFALLYVFDVFAVAAAVGGAATASRGHLGDVSVNLNLPRRMRGANSLAADSTPWWQGKALHFAAVGAGTTLEPRTPIEHNAPPFPEPYAVSPKRCPTGFSRVGCVDDANEAHRRWYADHIPEEDKKPMSPQVCFNFCSNVSGASYFGLKNGKECYCSPYFTMGPGKFGDDCDEPCEGDGTVMCGGSFRADIYEMHDCNNMPALPCKRPPGFILHAKTYTSRYYRKAPVPCKNTATKALDTYDSLCHVECEDGYWLERNDLKCVEKGDRLTYAWAQLQGKAICSPVKCGNPPTVQKAKYARVPVYFPDSVHYKCKMGYTLDGLWNGNKTHVVSCQADATFTASQPCLPVSCGQCPPSLGKLTYATHSEGTSQKVFQELCRFECNEGYTLDQQATGVATFNTQCMANGNFSEPPECKPVRCGPPPSFRHTLLGSRSVRGDNTTAVYQDVIDYECEVGYSLNSLASGETEFDLTCQSNGFFTRAPSRCKPVRCGAPAPVANAQYSENPLVYLETVTYTCDYGYTFDGTATGGRQVTIACGSDGQFEQVAPQCIPVDCGPAPTYSNAAADDSSLPARINFASPQLTYTCSPGYSTAVDDNPRDPQAMGFTTGCEADGSFTEVLPCVNIDDCLVHTCGPNGNCVDVAEPTGVAFDDYYCTCEAGYEETNQNATGRPGEFEKICTNIDDCPRVETCGGENAYGATRGTCQDLLLNYTCLCGTGYELTRLDEHPDNATCTPVKAGPVPAIDNAMITGMSPAAEVLRYVGCFVNDGSDRVEGHVWHITFPECEAAAAQEGKVMFGREWPAGSSLPGQAQCLLLDGVPSMQRAPDSECEEEGIFSGDRQGGTYRLAVYLTQAPADVYSFFGDNTMCRGEDWDVGGWPKAQSGTLTVAECSSLCSLDPECTAFDVSPAPSGGCNLFGHADVTGDAGSGDACYKKVQADYDTPPWNYTCDEGYTLDGLASGSSIQPGRCTASATFGVTQECQPVSCGTLKPVTHADVSPMYNELVYPLAVTYSCEEGYSLTGQYGDAVEFYVGCQSSGNQTALSRCQPVECGTIPDHVNATYDTERVFVYPQVATIDCLEGHSFDKTANPASATYTLTCLSNGTWSRTQQCQRVECGVPVDVNNTVPIPNSKFFQDRAEYELNDGFSLDGTVSGRRQFSTECLSSTLFTPTLEVMPISCGVPPSRDNAYHTEAGTSYVFRETADFVCETGYSLDSNADGVKTFQLTCVANGTFTGPAGCLPVQCGAVEALSNADQVDDNTNEQHTSLVFGQIAQFRCKPGYARDGRLQSTDIYPSVTCNANGTLVYPTDGCIDMNDCVGPLNRCSQDGTCQNNAVPTGTHADDFQCVCDSGFAENVSAEGRYCYNVPDCPQDACVPGTCHDLINDYECSCPTGYFPSVEPRASLLQTKKQDVPHHCLSVSCGVVPAVENAHGMGPSASMETFFDSPPVTLECDTGYTLDGTAAGENNFSLSCLANESFQRPPVCHPVACGTVPVVANADYTDGSLVYPEQVTYICRSGYSTDATYAVGNTEFSTSCLANGSYAVIPECLPIECPAVPSQDYTSANHGGAELVYPQTLSSTCSPGYALEADKHELTSYTIKCDAQGVLAYVEGSGTTPLDTRRCTAIDCGDFPTVEQATVAGSRLFGETATVTCNTGHSVDQSVLADKAVQDITCESSGSYSSAQPCLPVLCGVATAVANTTRSTEEAQVFEEVVTYTLNDGYTLDATPGGTKTFTVECQADGTFTQTSSPMPVSCGPAPNRSHTSWPARTRVYTQKEPYTCKTGYSVDGQASGPKSFELECQADGTYSGPAGCQAVECGAPPVPPNSQRIGASTDVVFPQTANFMCVAGYSLDGRMEGLTQFSTRCLANGSVSVHPGCLNKNDCEGHMCGPNGECVDHANPTGNHIEDYHCNCNSGFEEEMSADGKRTCGNIPDCPEGACLPGSCHDLVNDYRCECPAGYRQDANSAENLAHDCMPEPCGNPPTAPNAQPQRTGEILFNSGPVEYRCNEGYSVDQAPGGVDTFEITCQSDKSFTPLTPCLPVLCGMAPSVENAADIGNTNWTYTQTIDYQCLSGYSVDGTAAGAKGFTVSCEATGDFSGVQTCQPIHCPAAGVEFGANATHDTTFAAVMVFPQELDVTCIAGHALEKDVHTNITYKAKCTADGTFFIPAVSCGPIDCGPRPTVQHGSIKPGGSTLFGGKLQVVADDGWSKNGASGFFEAYNEEISCQVGGGFSTLPVFERVLCGSAPELDNTTRDTGAKVFEDTARYTLDAGFSLDGTAAGAKEFDIVCQANGSFTTPRLPQPISCGALPAQNDASSLAEGNEHVFPEQATYVCDSGYSTDGQPRVEDGQAVPSRDGWAVECTADGTYAVVGGIIGGGTKSCRPVQCGAFTPPQHATQLVDEQGQKLLSLEFGQTARFQCNSGYSKDGNLDSALIEFRLSCQPSGEVLYPATCINNDDCASASNQCASNGRCVDKETPTGTHRQDFECECDSGFVHQVREAGSSFERFCENVEDCPEGACAPGQCHDLINDYECACTDGYYTGANQAEGLAHDCLPKSCGVPPSVTNAQSSVDGQEVFFDEAPITYTCDDGYTLDGTASGDSSYTILCQANETFEPTRECLPVSCGAAPAFQFATTTATSLADVKFPTRLSYACPSGYTLDGEPGGTSTFDVDCNASGVLVGAQACQPVRCIAQGNVMGQNVSYDEGALSALVYPNQVNGTCMPGFALDKDNHFDVSFSARCEASGSIATPTSTCTPIDCGQAPNITNAAVEGSTLFGETMTARAYTGYSQDGTATGPKLFEFTCSAKGYFSGVKAFQRIECGETPQVSNVGSITLHETGVANGVGNASSPLFGDVLEFTCATGYRVSMRADPPVQDSDPTSFKMECKASGDLRAIEPADLHAPDCVPVTCEVHEPDGSVKEIPIFEVNQTSPIQKNFREQLSFVCQDGYNLDGTPGGEHAFYETCLANGSMSQNVTCKDIDWCLQSQCGEHGECVDQLLEYECTCADGYESVLMADGRSKTCVNIDECQTQGGAELCAGSVNGGQGSCVDEVTRYSCSCNDGYENAPFPDDANLDTCSPVECPAVPEVDFAVADKEGQKLVYLQNATYTCETGYSLDGTDAGPITFSIMCKADRTYSRLSQCKPIVCGYAPYVPNATLVGSNDSLTYGQVADYTCALGFTPSGSADAPNNFSVTCTSTGDLTLPQSCQRVSCDVPPVVHNADLHMEETFYGDVVDYTCSLGFTTTGEASGPAKFKAGCGEDGVLFGVQSCTAVTCGQPAQLPNTLMPLDELFYPTQFEAVCDSGYTTTGGIEGPNTFIVTCEADGQLAGIVDCRPVSCGKPPGTNASDGVPIKDPNVACTAMCAESVYLESAVWTCREGFTVDGTKTGATQYTRQCEADGEFSQTPPTDCMDIDFCQGNPCSANGACTDAGVGIPFPGYTCECYEGFEVTARADGSPVCTEDDCAGEPCGAGGTCTDLSKQGGAPGTYTCECEPGYDFHEPAETPGQPTCRRSICGTLPAAIGNTVQNNLNLPAAVVTRYTPIGGTPVPESDLIDAFTQTPVMRSFDSAEWECQDGYSTDGSTNTASKKFSVTCEASGVFDRDISPNQECQPVQCDNYALPQVPNAYVLDSQDFYRYGDNVAFKCQDGYTIGGELGQAVEFTVPCQQDGTFPETAAQCLPIKCDVPFKNHTSTSASGRVNFETTVAFTCHTGYVTGDDTTYFSGRCKENGQFDFGTADTSCVPCSCGVPPLQPNADLLLEEAPGFFLSLSQQRPRKLSLAHGRRAKTSSVPGYTVFGYGQEAVYTTPPLRVQCATDHTVGGEANGATSYTIQCLSDKSFTEVSAQCSEPRVQVEGEVTDAQNARLRLGGVQLTFHKNGQEVGTASTAGNGRYSLQLPMGKLLMTATRGGYIDYNGNITVAGRINRGQGADLGMSKVLPPGQWRVVLTWGRRSTDLDSHTFFGRNARVETSWRKMSRTDYHSGLQVDLDRDDVTSFGPETTTFKNVGKCPEGAGCLIYFAVRNYAHRSGTLGASEAIVTLYRGNRIEGRYEIPESVGRDRWYDVFTLDATEGSVKVYDGYYSPPPTLTGAQTGRKDWRSSFNFQTWSNVPSDALLYGITAGRQLARLHQIEYAQYYEVEGERFECQWEDWSGEIAQEGHLASCPEGYFIQGLFREGNMWDRVTSVSQLTKAKCCWPKGLPKQWGECRLEDAWESDCSGDGTKPDAALVGLHHANADKTSTLQNMDQLKCCTFATPE